MDFSLGKGTNELVLDCSSSNIKLAVGSYNSKTGNVTIEKMGVVPLEGDAINDGAVSDSFGVVMALKHAIGAMNRDFEGTQHTALADAANAAAILALLQDDEEFFRVMQPVIDLLKPKELSQSIGDLFPELSKLKFGDWHENCRNPWTARHPFGGGGSLAEKIFAGRI